MTLNRLDMLFLCGLVAGTVLGLVTPAAAVGETAEKVDDPVIFAPKDETRLGDDETPCIPHPEGPCYQLHVRGQVPVGKWPFLVVAPLSASPKMWIQPPITVVRRNGVFEGLTFLGTAEVGAGQKYHVFILAHDDKHRFEDGDVLTDIPKDCESSDPITIHRTR